MRGGFQTAIPVQSVTPEDVIRLRALVHDLSRRWPTAVINITKGVRYHSVEAVYGGNVVASHTVAVVG